MSVLLKLCTGLASDQRHQVSLSAQLFPSAWRLQRLSWRPLFITPCRNPTSPCFHHCWNTPMASLWSALNQATLLCSLPYVCGHRGGHKNWFINLQMVGFLHYSRSAMHHHHTSAIEWERSQIYSLCASCFLIHYRLENPETYYRNIFQNLA